MQQKDMPGGMPSVATVVTQAINKAASQPTDEMTQPGSITEAVTKAINQVNDRSSEVENLLYRRDAPALPPARFAVDALVVAGIAWLLAMLFSLTSFAVVIAPGIAICAVSTWVMALVLPAKTIRARVALGLLQTLLQLFIMVTSVAIIHAFAVAEFRRQSSEQERESYSSAALRHLEQHSAPVYYFFAGIAIVVLLWQAMLLVACECCKK